MTVQEVIDELTNETYPNEKSYTLDIKDRNGKYYEITGYDWCNQTLLIEEIK